VKWSVLIFGAAGSLASHPLRSLLTVLGVIAGVAAVMVVIAAGEGSRRKVTRQLELLGSNLLIVLPGPAAGGSEARTDTLAREDALAIESEIKGVKTSSEVLARQTASVKANALSVPVVGCTPSFREVRNFELSAGRFFTTAEESGRARVAVLGARTARRLFERGDALGGYIRLKGARYRVIGVLEEKGDLGWFHPDDLVVVPLSTAQTRILGIKHVHAIAVACPSQETMGPVSRRIRAMLRRIHRLPSELAESRLDFHIMSQRQMVEAMVRVDRTLKALLISLAAVALITGGIGIMNIMLVSVTERTSEIGIRKAVGATGLDIFLQFLAESVMLASAGAVLGIALGAVSSDAVSAWGGWDLVISWRGAALAVGVAFAVGLLFGIYPALRAAAQEPVEALRT